MRYSFYDNAEYTINDDLYYIRLYPEYDEEESLRDDIKFTYESADSPEMSKLFDFWEIKNAMGTGGELNRLIKLRRYAAEMLGFPGISLTYRKYDGLNCYDTVKTAKKEGHSLNCRYMSLIFTQMLLSAGFRARWVACLPMELNYSECHCVTEVFVEELGKWIIVDSALDLVYFNKKGELLNLYDIRQMILRGDKIRIMASRGNTDTLDVEEYWTRHVFRFKFLLDNGFDMLNRKDKTYVFLNPKNFVVSDKIINHADGKTTKIINVCNDRYFWEET